MRGLHHENSRRHGVDELGGIGVAERAGISQRAQRGAGELDVEDLRHRLRHAVHVGLPILARVREQLSKFIEHSL